MATSRAGRYPTWYRDDVVYVSAGDTYTSSRFGANTHASPAQLAAMHGLEGAPNLLYTPTLDSFDINSSELADRDWYTLRANQIHPTALYWRAAYQQRTIEPQRGVAYICLESMHHGVRYSAVDVAALHGMPTSHVSCFLARTMEEARNMTNGYRRAWFMTRGNVGDEPNIVDISTGSELLPTAFHRGGIATSYTRIGPGWEGGRDPTTAARDQADPDDFTDGEDSPYGRDLNLWERVPGANMRSGGTVSVDPAAGPDQTSVTRVGRSGPVASNNVTLQASLEDFDAENLRLALGGTRGVQGRMRLEPGMESQEVRPITAAQAIQNSYFGAPIPARVSDVSVNVNNAGMLSPEQAGMLADILMNIPRTLNITNPVAAAEAARAIPPDEEAWVSGVPPEVGSKSYARVVKRGCIGVRASGLFHCPYRWGCDKCPVKLEEAETVVDAGRLTRFVRRKKT